MPITNKPQVGVWIGIGVLAFVCRAQHLFTSADEALSGDAIHYEDLAWKIANGWGYTSMDDEPMLYAPRGEPTAFRTPGLPLFAAAAYVAVGRRPAVVRTLLVLLNVAGALALFAFALQYGRRAALIAGITWAAWPGSSRTYWSSDAFLAESLAVPLLLLGVWGLTAFASRASLLLAGLSIGCALLTRSYLLFFLPTAVVVTGVMTRGDYRRLWRLGLATGISVLPLVPWALRNFAVFGEFIPLSTQAGCSLWVGNNRDARGSGDSRWQNSWRLAALKEREPRLVSVAEPEKSRIYLRATRDEIEAGGLAWYAWLIARKGVLFFVPLDGTYGLLWWLVPVILLLPFGVITLLRAPPSDATTLTLAAVLSVLLAVLINYHDSRYRYSAEPFMVLLAAIAFDELVSRLRQRGGWKGVGPAMRGRTPH